ncbi:MAG: putative chromate transport protein [Paracidovorax wautersii]|uniref:Putative chromate transport protein n=1 Tax=Paracidovorax wautersii TaxID=1177982 RepID=A0A7V8JPG0_9BURK|nr:MAG: putative chromate transport protein [Paracidovorax wautersii]
MPKSPPSTTPLPPPSDDTTAWRPQNKWQLCTAFAALAMQGFGGVLTVVQRELVEKKRWMTPAEFIEDWTVAQILPGPNVVNLALILGDRYFGLSGAMAALAGLFALPLMLVLGLTLAYQQFLDVPAVVGALKGMGAVAAGLIMATGVKLIGSLRLNPMGLAVGIGLMLITFGCVAFLLHWPLIGTLLGVGLPAYAWAWYRLWWREKDASGHTTKARHE